MRLILWTACALTVAAGLAGPAGAQSDCRGAIQAACLESLGAGAEPLPGSDCERQRAAYRACLAKAAVTAPAAGGAACDGETTARLWASVEASKDCLSYEGFREACPDRPEARFALSAMRRLGCRAAEETSPAGEAASLVPAALASDIFLSRLQTAPQGAGLKECDLCPEMALIPGGTFLMGSPESEKGRNDYESPQREIAVAPFALGRYEVSFAEWDACVADGGCSHRPDDEGWGRGDRPVINIGQDEAREYIGWVNAKVEGAPYRLPSEAEWEYAARAGTTTPYWWGETATTARANFAGETAQGEENRGRTLPVKSFEPNPFGLYQILGNVAEWTSDCWSESHAEAPADGAPRDGTCAHAAYRGGAWSFGAEALRAAARDHMLLKKRYNDTGFRIARSFAKK